MNLKKNFVLIISTILFYGLVLSPPCVFPQEPVPEMLRYGAPGVGYGEDLHPGIDYTIPIGTPILAVSDGIVVIVREPCPDQIYCGGLAVIVKHSDDFFSFYFHLSKTFVTIGESIKRGERLGLSGKSNGGWRHLHFGLLKNVKEGSGAKFSQSYNPKNYWLGGKPQCFPPQQDYSKYTVKEITHPVECDAPK
ncbi:MAG: M23 family metallopeptidase [Desulfobacterales bacterium]|nr:M23 family metallopeptidase [Muriicola sp.]NNK96063.1 M23 family metallopeptidase [Desulfobacterales bacterium]